MNIKEELIARQCLSYSGQDGVPECQWIGTSGAHLLGYFCLDPASPDVLFLRQLARQLIAPFVGRGIRALVTPATGSIPLCTAVAEELIAAENDPTIKSIWADKVVRSNGTKGFDLPRPTFAGHLKGRGTLVVEDVINRQYTASQVIDVVRQSGGEIVGVATVAAQGNVNTESLGVPLFHNLCEIAYDTWEPEQCAIDGPCYRNLPIVVDPGLGHGSEFQEANPGYPGGYITLLD